MTPCTLLKNITHTKNPRHGISRCPQRRPKEFMDHVTNTFIEVVIRVIHEEERSVHCCTEIRRYECHE
jgi:hypothetical protein